MKVIMENWRGFNKKLLLKESIEEAAAALQAAFQFNKEVQERMSDAPDKPSKEEQALFAKLVQPTLDNMDKLTDATPTDAKEFSEWREKFREGVQASIGALKKMFSQAQEQGFTISKPYLGMVAKRSEQDLKQAQETLKTAQELQGFIDAKEQATSAAKSQMGTDKENYEKILATNDFVQKKLEVGFKKAMQSRDLKAMEDFQGQMEQLQKLNKEKKYDEIAKLAQKMGMQNK